MEKTPPTTHQQKTIDILTQRNQELIVRIAVLKKQITLLESRLSRFDRISSKTTII